MGNYFNPPPKPAATFDSRVFALFLITVASIYVLIMICQAYRSRNDDAYASTYYYETESYDFNPYQSEGTVNQRN